MQLNNSKSRAALDVARGDRRWSLSLGDCRTLLARLPDASIDAIITDPPYGMNYVSWTGQRVKNDGAPFVWWLGEVDRLLKDDGCLFCFTIQQVQEDWRRAISWAGLKIQSQIIWDKCVHGSGDCKRQFGPQHELAWFATKKGYGFPGKRPTTVIRHSRVHAVQRLHPTEKPVDLMKNIVESITEADDVVLDPFAGSGSTGVACVELGRRFIGCELVEEYVNVARTRLRKAKP